MTTSPLLELRDVVVEYRRWGRPTLRAVDGVSLQVNAGQTVGLVGESGCGKSSLARAMVCLEPVASGQILFDGDELTGLPESSLRVRRADFQMIFQNPLAALNPRRRVRDIVAEGLDIFAPGDRAQRAQTVSDLLTSVGLNPGTDGDRFPHEFSGGQCQRIGIARALAVRPRLLVCDEPVSALDVSVQGQILNLLEQMRAEFDLTTVFISHDLAVIKSVSDVVVVMYLGKVCEVAPAASFYAEPRHPYSEALLAAVPSPRAGARPVALEGEIPSPLAPPSGCVFRTRCRYATSRCATEVPVLESVGDGRSVACHFPLSVQAV